MAKVKLTGWKQKRPYIIQAPEKFDYHELGTTISSDPKLLIGRTISMSLADLTSDRAKQHLLVVFEVIEVAGDKAKTKFKRFGIQAGYLKSKIRKGMSKIDYQSDLIIADATLRIKIIVLTSQHLTTPKRKDIASSIGRVLAKYKEATLDEFVQQVLFGKIGHDIYKKVKKICPVGRVEVFEIKKISA
ncbi:MAG: hypothetical protein PHG85_04820 [Candidatus Altiarchaeota archaeon]|nr:hypothetical protein [Candidatus Altiarchaeota archaeon]